MSTLREAAQQALEALEFLADEWGFTRKANRPERWRAIDALRSALAQQEQEPSVCARCGGLVYDPVWVAQSDPPRREWRGLTEEEIWKDERIMAENARCGLMMSDLSALARAIEQALKEKNNG